MPELLVEWAELVAALLCFLFAHMLPARPSVRSAIVGAIGRGKYLVLYSLLSVGLLMWVARAAARSPYVEIWAYDESLVLVPMFGMGVACVLLVFGLASPNPLSIGRAEGFHPARPGIAGVVRHPVLWAALIWATTHAVINGDVAHLVVFGAFAILATAGMLALDRRAQRRLGPGWSEIAAHTSNIPFVGYLRGARPSFGLPTVLRAGLTVLLYAGLYLSHEFIAGVPVPV